eukprot:4772920-Heterocapsa_arctica.AAC.1
MRVGAVSGAVRTARRGEERSAPIQVLRRRLSLRLSLRLGIRDDWRSGSGRGGSSFRLRLGARGRIEKSGLRLRNLFVL